MVETHIHACTVSQQHTAMCTATTVSSSFMSINEELIFFLGLYVFFPSQSIQQVFPSVSYQDPHSLVFAFYYQSVAFDCSLCCSGGGKHKIYHFNGGFMGFTQYGHISPATREEANHWNLDKHVKSIADFHPNPVFLRLWWPEAKQGVQLISNPQGSSLREEALCWSWCFSGPRQNLPGSC